MPNKSKSVRCQYDDKDMERAVTAVSCGMSIRTAAAQFGVPRSTLHDRLSGKVGPSPSHGKQTVFPEIVERKFAEKIKEAATMGFGLDRKQLQVKAAQLAKKMKLKTPFKSGIPGKDWLSGFLKRHSITLRCQTALSTVRGRMLNETVIQKYFDDLQGVIESLNLQNSPEQIWNMDESSLSLTHKPTKVYAEKSARNIPGRVGNNRETVTITACVNAAGNDIPPMIIVKGKTRKSLHAYNLKSGPVGAKYTYQEKGWMENSLGKEWFDGVFLEHCGTKRPQLLILDSHSSHETLDIIQSAKENNVTLFALPPHTTQWLNPLDKTLFGPLSKEYNKQCTYFMTESPNNIVCKWEFPRLFKIAYEIAFNKHNIRKGFETCGIFPFNPKAIPPTAINPSLPFDMGMAHKSLVNDPHQGSQTQQPDHSPDLTKVTKPIENQCNDHAGRPTQELNVIPQQTSVDIIAEADANGVMEIEAAEAAEVLQAILDSNIDLQIDHLFELPSPVRKTQENKKRKLTSHRILTSDEIIQEKENAKQMKEEQIKIKAEKKKERELNRVQNSSKKSKPNKKTKPINTRQ